MKRKLTMIALLASLAFSAAAQEPEATPLDTLTNRVGMIQSNLDVLNRIKISGYLQPQYQVADSTGQQSYAGGNFTDVDKRFQLRRARVKVQYDAPLNEKGISPAQFVFQIDVTQNGVTIKDMYGKLTDKWTGWFSLTAGMQNRPFGYEIGYSSSMRESPERGRMSQIIFPNERDLGAMITIQGPKTSNWNWLKLEAGLFNGTGGPSAGINASDFDTKKDFISHLSMTRTAGQERIKYGLGVSFYDGGFRIDTSNVWKPGFDAAGTAGFIPVSTKADVPASKASREYAKRKYVGVDAQFSIDWAPGLTTVRGEYIEGEQPGTSSTTVSPVAAVVTNDIYNRNFNGAYFYFLQDILQTPLQFIVKYDWYDPNTDVEGDQVGKAVTGSNVKATTVTDLKYTTLGLGMAYRYNENVKFTAYWDMVENETSSNLSSGINYSRDLPDDVFTLRMQVKF